MKERAPATFATPTDFAPGRVRWWQWLTVLSLDAPLVAVAWQTLFARVSGSSTLRSYHSLLLGLAVWLAYAADRWIEGWRLTPQTVRTQRHYFYLRYRWPALAVWLAALGGALGLAALKFSIREWFFSLALLIPALVYLLSHQFLHRTHPWRVPKELCVAAILALGAALYPAANSPDGLLALAVPTAFFFLLALANCLLISDWEREVDLHQGQTSLALRYGSARTVAAVLPWCLLVLAASRALTRVGPVRVFTLCAAASALLLGILSLTEPRLGRELARVLADLALLTPLLVWIIG